MRIVQKDQVILAGSRLALISVDKHVFGLGRLLGDKRPFHAGGEPRAAPATEVGGFHLVDDPVGALIEALLCRPVAAEFDIAVDLLRALAEAAGDDLDLVGMGYEPR